MNQIDAASTVPAAPTHLLFFADVDEFANVEEGLVGPAYFHSERDALAEFVTYLLPRLESDSSMSEVCLGAVAAGGWIESPMCTFRDIDGFPTPALVALCDAYTTERSRQSYQVFYRVAKIPTAL